MTLPPIPSRAYLEGRLSRTLNGAGVLGYTVREFLLDVPESHHGQVSAMFSDLHRAGAIACLQLRRSDYCVYVLPRFVKGRSTRPHRSERRLSNRERLLERADALHMSMAQYAVPKNSPIGMQAQALLDEIERQFS